MPVLNTFILAVQPSNWGANISDVVVVGGKVIKSPLRLLEKGDGIDLTKVDVTSFCRSLHSGIIRDMVMRGSLIGVQQEVTEELFAQFQSETNRLLSVSPKLEPYSRQSSQAVVIGPGLQAGVGRPEGPGAEYEPPTSLAEFPRPNVMRGMRVDTGGQIGPGLAAGAPQGQAPAGGDLEISVGAIAHPEPPAAQVEPEKAPVAKEDATEVQSSWKKNLSFQDQKKKISESTDETFLEEVAAKDESKQFQKLAAARLAELREAK
jgi:hypothetical protein